MFFIDYQYLATSQKLNLRFISFISKYFSTNFDQHCQFKHNLDLTYSFSV